MKSRLGDHLYYDELMAALQKHFVDFIPYLICPIQKYKGDISIGCDTFHRLRINPHILDGYTDLLVQCFEFLQKVGIICELCKNEKGIEVLYVVRFQNVDHIRNS